MKKGSGVGVWGSYWRGPLQRRRMRLVMCCASHPHPELVSEAVLHDDDTQSLHLLEFLDTHVIKLRSLLRRPHGWPNVTLHVVIDDICDWRDCYAYTLLFVRRYSSPILVLLSYRVHILDRLCINESRSFWSSAWTWDLLIWSAWYHLRRDI